MDKIQYPIPVLELTSSMVDEIMMEDIPSDNNSDDCSGNENTDSDPEFNFSNVHDNVLLINSPEHSSESEDESVIDATPQNLTWSHVNSYKDIPSFTLDTGPSSLVKNLTDPSPYDLFSLLFDEQIINEIVFQTNLYAQQSGKRYVPVSSTEINAFLGINLLMGIKKSPSYRDYWSSAPDLNDSYISKLMTVNRFGWILSNLHLNDNSVIPVRGSPGYNKLYKLQPYLDKLQNNFKKCFQPSRILSVDESMIKFKGRCSFKQYMPKKPIKRGYKVWILADKTGYVLNFEIYTGKKGNSTEKKLGERVVLSMTEALCGYNHTIYFDNYFTSVDLMEQLKAKNILACGTVNKTRINLPKFEDDKSLSRGYCDWWCKGELCAIKWKDKRCVYLLSNFHNPESIITVKRRERDGSTSEITCPVAVADYNSNMNCVDKFDQMKAAYEIDRKSRKWWHRIFFYLLDTCVVNASILYKKLNLPPKTMKQFRREVIDGLISNRFIQVSPKPHFPVLHPNKKQKLSHEIRLTSAAHQPQRTTRRRCALCSTKKKPIRSDWACITCNVALCLGKDKDCFQKFHSVKDL